MSEKYRKILKKNKPCAVLGKDFAQDHEYENQVGSRRRVWNGTAHHTKSGLTRSDLYYDPKAERIKSIKKAAKAFLRLKKKVVDTDGKEKSVSEMLACHRKCKSD